MIRTGYELYPVLPEPVAGVIARAVRRHSHSAMRPQPVAASAVNDSSSEEAATAHDPPTAMETAEDSPATTTETGDPPASLGTAAIGGTTDGNPRPEDYEGLYEGLPDFDSSTDGAVSYDYEHLAVLFQAELDATPAQI